MPATLNTHLQQVQRFLRDSQQAIWDPADLMAYVNQARREVAMRSQCIRVMPWIWGSIQDTEIVSGGTGYTNPTVVVSAPDSPSGQLRFAQGNQATMTAVQTGGVITSITDIYGGDGYFQPVINIVDPTGSGAVINPIMSPISQVNAGQETYKFSDFDLAQFPGVSAIYTIRSVSIIYTNYRYSLPMYSFSKYQSAIRQYTIASYQYVPVFAAQFGRGAAGSLLMYPPPSQAYQLEIDCSCLPMDLVDDQSEEATPDPWCDAVPFYAAYLAYLEIQNLNAARSYLAMFDEKMTRYGHYVDVGRAINPYGRP